MLWLLVVGELLRLADGRTFACDSFKRDVDIVLITAGDQRYSLPAALVDWQGTARAMENPPAVTVEGPAVETKREAPKYRGFIIQKLDVTRTSLIDLLRFMAEMVGINLYIDGSVVDRKVTYLFKNIPWDQALTIILFDAGLNYAIAPQMLQVRG